VSPVLRTMKRILLRVSMHRGASSLGSDSEHTCDGAKRTILCVVQNGKSFEGCQKHPCVTCSLVQLSESLEAIFIRGERYIYKTYLPCKRLIRRDLSCSEVGLYASTILASALPETSSDKPSRPPHFGQVQETQFRERHGWTTRISLLPSHISE
jgi:hypothetical protein